MKCRTDPIVPHERDHIIKRWYAAKSRPERDALQRERNARIVLLSRAGYSGQRIGKVFNLSRAGVHSIVWAGEIRDQARRGMLEAAGGRPIDMGGRRDLQEWTVQSQAAEFGIL